MASVNRPNNPCKNPHCGNTLFIRDYEFDYSVEPVKSARIWKCTNCTWTQARETRNRRTNKTRAFDLYLTIRKEWEEIDKALDTLCATDNPNRISNGAIMVHSSLFNYHLGK